MKLITYNLPMNVKASFLLMFGFLLFPGMMQQVFAQDNRQQTPRFFEFKFSNDFVFETDRYFTNGLDLAFFSPKFKVKAFDALLYPGFHSSKELNGVNITQHFFTPAELFSSEPIPADRPYASYLQAGIQKISLSGANRIKVETQWQAGLLGKYSGGAFIQNGVHEILPTSRKALGWDNQINADLAINYRYRLEKGLINHHNFIWAPYAESRIGIPFTDLKTGFYFRFGKFNRYFNSFEMNNTRNFEFYFYADLSLRLVGYNATLQGGLFAESPQTLAEINRMVSDFKSGFVIRHKRFGIAYEQHFISPEFTLGMPHKWAALSLSFAF